MSRYELLPPRPLNVPLRPLSSARTWNERFGRASSWRIQHGLLEGVRPADVLWFFKHLDVMVELGGKATPLYLLWHPVDHIAWEEVERGPQGRGAGSRWRIVEAIAGRVHVFNARLWKLDETGIVFDAMQGPLVMARMEHRWAPMPNGTFYDTALTLNPRGSWLVERMLAAFGHFTPDAWLRHNVEEVGLLTHLIPRFAPRQLMSPPWPLAPLLNGAPPPLPGVPVM